MGVRLSLRERNRLEAMRLVQVTAVPMFESSSFTATTVEAIAEAAGVSASTIYRHFRAKEQIVLWDERDAVVDAELDRRLRTHPPVVAFRDAVIAAYADREDLEFFRRRLRLIYSEPSIGAAAAQQDRIDRADLAHGIAQVAGRTRASVSEDVTAAVCLAALDVALERWQLGDRPQDLSGLVSDACAAVAITR